MKKTRPSNLEMQVLSVLWENGPSTARQVLEAMPDGKDRAYTTALSVMQVMEKKGLLKHDTDGNRHVYYPTVKKGEVLGSFLKSMVLNLFGGRPASAMQHLLETTPVSREELVEMKSLLDDYTERKTTKKL